MTKSVAWGILGTGSIARIFARGLAESGTGGLVAVGSRSRENADSFASELRAPRAYGSYEELLEDPGVQVVYVATPHAQHAEWAIKAAEVGKHVLVEKPIALNHAEAMAVVEAASRHDVFLMEAFMYRCHPQTARLAQLVRDGAIGEVRLIQASFGFDARPHPAHRLFDNSLGGGGIMDVGCYPVSMARLLAGAAQGRPFADPVEVRGTAHVGELGVDEQAAAVLKFPGGIVAEAAAAVRVGLENAVRVFGTEGSILVPDPWRPGMEGQSTKIALARRGEEPREIVIAPPAPLYAIEADTVAEYLERREAPQMTWDDSLGNMRVLDQWRQQAGLVFAPEQPENQRLPVHKRPLRVRADSKMRYGRIEGVKKPVSRLVMGADNQATLVHASVMFDDFFERGGNCFDTAYIYGGGSCERILGQWVRNRGVREQVVILDKGAHTPHCNPEALTRQHHESLERLGMDYVDIYMLHRDNPEIPVAEFIDVLNEHKRAGTMRAFGASNWSLARVQEANEYAGSKGLDGFVAISNNFSLARMVEPVWAGCISASDPESRRWLTEHQMPLMPWSSQARGFFTERAGRDKLSDPELVRCWYSEDNFERRDRAIELAKRKGVEPINIALAYVLAQPFPTFPLIGPRLLSETRSSFRALEVELTPEEARWLNLEE